MVKELKIVAKVCKMLRQLYFFFYKTSFFGICFVLNMLTCFLVAKFITIKSWNFTLNFKGWWVGYFWQHRKSHLRKYKNFISAKDLPRFVKTIHKINIVCFLKIREVFTNIFGPKLLKIFETIGRHVRHVYKLL